MFNQFENTSEHSGFWIEEAEGRKVLLGKTPDTGQAMDYQSYRWLHRRIARSTDTRTLIASIAPPMVFTEVNSTTLKVGERGMPLCVDRVGLAPGLARQEGQALPCEGASDLAGWVGEGRPAECTRFFGLRGTGTGKLAPGQ